MHYSSREQPEHKTKNQPADERREKRAHSFGGPLRRLSGEERKQDNIDRPHIGRPNAAAVIARSAAAPSRPIGCGKAKVYAVPRIAPTARPNDRLPNPPTSKVPAN